MGNPSTVHRNRVSSQLFTATQTLFLQYPPPPKLVPQYHWSPLILSSFLSPLLVSLIGTPAWFLEQVGASLTLNKPVCTAKANACSSVLTTCPNFSTPNGSVFNKFSTSSSERAKFSSTVDAILTIFATSADYFSLRLNSTVYFYRMIFETRSGTASPYKIAKQNHTEKTANILFKLWLLIYRSERGIQLLQPNKPHTSGRNIARPTPIKTPITLLARTKL